MKLIHSFQGKTLICVEDFSFFKEKHKYYCIYDSGEYFYVWCNEEVFGVNEIKISKGCRKHFKVEPF